MASLVPAVNWKFWFMFIIEITLCYFVKLNGMIKGMLFLMSKKKKKWNAILCLITRNEKWHMLEGLVLSLDCFMLVKNTCSHTCISSTIKKKYCTNIYIFWYLNSNHLYNSKIVLNGSILLGYNLFYYTWASTCILTEFVNANFRFFLSEINHFPWLCF